MQTDKPGRFIIRVYGILINDKNEVLLSDEFMCDMLMTKFPGGGLRQGEGPEDCLRREALEEFGQPVEITGHFYTTGFYQKAMFHENHQLISVYYRIMLTGPVTFPVSAKPFDFAKNINGSQSFRWKKIDELKREDFTFPVDQYVAEMLRKQYTGGGNSKGPGCRGRKFKGTGIQGRTPGPGNN